VAGFYTYREWIDNFVVAMNTPGTTVARLPGDSPVFKWTNTIGTIAYQTKVYRRYGPFAGGYVIVLPNGTIIPYGAIGNTAGSSLSNFYFTNHIYITLLANFLTIF